MAHEYPRTLDQTGQETARLADALSTALKVAEAAHLQSMQRCIVCGEERVEGHGEDVDDGRGGFALPVEAGDLLEDVGGGFEVGYVFGGEELGKDEDVVEGDCHATAGEGMSHVHCIAEDEEARSLLGSRWKERVGHAAEFAGFNGFAERGLRALGNVG
jgi:hypothetical protein